jgi:hypothetical protein
MCKLLELRICLVYLAIVARVHAAFQLSERDPVFLSSRRQAMEVLNGPEFVPTFRNEGRVDAPKVINDSIANARRNAFLPICMWIRRTSADANLVR